MKFPILLLIVVLFSCQSPKEKNPKEVLSQHKVMSTLWYQQSAEMTAVYLQAYRYGKFLLANKLDTLPADGKYAVVLDIDETVLDNSPHEVTMIETEDTYSTENWQEWTFKARARALPGALDFVNYAEGLGVEVFYISNRKENELEATMRNLDSLNFPNADSVHVLLRKETGDKTARRESVSSKAQIILFVGDNLTDYSEIFADRGSDLGKNLVYSTQSEWQDNLIILPNPGYGEWEKAIYGNDYGISGEEKINRRLKALSK